jgi:phosphonate degradation associated HDIG domain protein
LTFLAVAGMYRKNTLRSRDSLLTGESQTMPAIITELLDLLERRGGESYYGEAVTQKEHALQAATAAERERAGAALIAAALLHDIGHLWADPSATAATENRDAGHEEVGAHRLAAYFPAEVTEPIRLHVPAKRYLCFAEPGYLAGLSPASLASLRLQGGPFTAEQARRFREHPHAEAALTLRRWDEAAKRIDFPTPDLDHFRRYLEAMLLPGQSAKGESVG